MATGWDLSHSILNTSDIIAEASCAFCLTSDGKQVESAHFCIDCGVELCQTCTEWHQNLPAMSTHQVVDVTLATGSSGKKGASLPIERCEEHHGKLIDHFCRNHDKLCCVSCVAIKHRNCLNLEYLPAFAQGTTKGKELKQLHTSTQLLMQELKQVKYSRNDLLQDINKKDIESQKSLQDLRTRLIKRIDNLVKYESDMIKPEYQEKEEDIQTDIQAIDVQIDATCKILDEFEGDNESQMFIYMKQVDKSKQKDKQLLNTLVPPACTHVPKYTIKGTLEQHLCKIPNIVNYEMHSSGNTAGSVKLIHENDLVVTAEEDTKECDIIGMCVLADGSVVLADYNNKCLKHIDSYSVTHTLDMYTEPSDICYIDNNNEMAVTFYNDGKVQFVREGETMKATRSFKLVWPGKRICYSQNEMFVCCEAKESEVVCVFTLSGQETRKIQVDWRGTAILSYLISFTVSSDGSKIHVADKNNVTTIDRAGKLVWRYTEPSLDAVGVCTLGDDSLLVANKTPHNILHLSSSGKKLDMVLFALTPEAVWYDNANNRVILRTNSSNTLEVYILEAV